MNIHDKFLEFLKQPFNEFLLQVNGGIGKHIILSSVFSDFFNKYNNTLGGLLTKTPEPFYNLGFNFLDYNEKRLLEKTLPLLSFDPYQFEELMEKEYPLSAIANEIIFGNLEYKKPTIKLSQEEERVGRSFRDKLIAEKGKKPIMIFQPFGGFFMGNFDARLKSLLDGFAQQIVNIHKDKYHILQIHTKEQHQLSDCISLSNYNIRELFSIISFGDKIISCDSFTPHASAAFGITSLVLWTTTSEKIFGHPIHINIRERELEQKIIPGPLYYKKQRPINHNINLFTDSTLEKINEYLDNSI